jgi:hypothetical protein
MQHAFFKVHFFRSHNESPLLDVNKTVIRDPLFILPGIFPGYPVGRPVPQQFPQRPGGLSP